MGGLKAFGEVWAISRRTESETKKIARSVFALPGPEIGGEAAGGFDFALESQRALPGYQEEAVVERGDLTELDGLNML